MLVTLVNRSEVHVLKPKPIIIIIYYYCYYYYHHYYYYYYYYYSLFPSGKNQATTG